MSINKVNHINKIKHINEINYINKYYTAMKLTLFSGYLWFFNIDRMQLWMK